MYSPPSSFDSLVSDLTLETGNSALARLLVYVELTLTLACRLGFESEPLTVGWVLLSRMPLYHPLLNRLTAEQRRMHANAALIVPLSSRFAWENALVQYAKDIPAHLRLYAVQPLPLDGQWIEFCRQQPCPHPLREERYTAILSETLPYRFRTRREVSVGKIYRVRVKDLDGKPRGGWVTIDESLRPEARGDVPWFVGRRPRTVFSARLSDLLPTAHFLDERERQLSERAHWVRDLQQIRYRKATFSDDQFTLGPENESPLHLEGMVHLPGMVSSGKTTLAKLIIAYCVQNGWDIRITMVVGDSHTAIEIAHQVNSWFYDDPAGGDVVAVPLLGATQREVHLGRLMESREYSLSLEKGKAHWGERWLMPACPLASRIQWEDQVNIVISAGSEPCQRLKAHDSEGGGAYHVCPLFHRCPSKQLYRDMPRAQLWVTTPGALSQAALPLHLDARIVKLGDLVYEQSDLVILDEVETIVDWFDRTFAVREELTNGKNGLLDQLDTQITQYWNSNRVLPPNHRRWIIPAREAIKVLSGILTTIADPNQERVVKNWVRRGSFAPNQLAYRLARRLAGLKEWDSATTLPEERHRNDSLASAAFEPFNELLNRTPDPLRYQVPPDRGETDKVGALARLMQAMNNLADDVFDEGIFLQCRGWILQWYPDVETRLAELRARLQASDDSFDREYLDKHLDRTVDEMVQRLQFVLMVALLDRHMHIVLQEWHNKPENLDAAEPFRRIPRGMQNILPLPLTGKQYGFVNGGSKHDDDARNKLSLFAYTNIGRSYLLDFNHLREDIEGTPGPHVLAFSGTSYLPDSTSFHVITPPMGILMAPKHTEAAINNSRFVWKYFVDDKNRPIFVSGRRPMEHQIRLLMKAMADDGGLPGGFIGKLLDWMEAQGRENPDLWGDRARVLLLTNSYSQARVAAQTLRECWRDKAGLIFHLRHGSKDEDYQIETVRDGTLQRVDIERFARTGGRVLAAPMQSIGRGFNILNDAPEPKAAFGAVLFLIRPMKQPHDLEVIAQELNRYMLEWAANPRFTAWQADTLYKRAINARDKVFELRRFIENRRSYAWLIDNAELNAYPRRDLAATTAGHIVQAVGRLLRGGVPFYAYFVDAAWSPELAKTGDAHRKEGEETSLLTAVINILSDYADANEIGKHLYGGLSEALIATENRDSN